jgi:hypothetical protein
LAASFIVGSSKGSGIGIADHVWSIGELIDAALANVPDDLGRRRKPVKLTVIEGGKA